MYDRKSEGRVLDLAVRAMEGDALRLYDRQTGSVWNQLDGRCLSGPLEGRQLGVILSTLTTWRSWRLLHPDTDVYLKSNAFYRQRFTASELREAIEEVNEPPGRETLILGLEIGGIAGAYPLRDLAGVEFVNGFLGGEPVGIWFSPDLTAYRAFSRVQGELTLNFDLTAEAGIIRDRETGSRWDLSSLQALDGSYEGARLRYFRAVLSRWGTWQLLNRESEYWRPEVAGTPNPEP